MSVNSDDFLLAAEQLLNNSSHEIDYRNSMSRAYYASFHALSPLSNQLPAVANYQIDNAIAKSDAEEQLLKAKFLLKQIANLKTALYIH